MVISLMVFDPSICSPASLCSVIIAIFVDDLWLLMLVDGVLARGFNVSTDVTLVHSLPLHLDLVLICT
jgi:hypothetical protein